MGNEARIDCDSRKFGAEIELGERVQIGGVGAPADFVEIGDNVQIGDDVRILAPRVYIGDYTVIRHHTTIYGYAPVWIGACSWIGQNAVLNCTAPLRIGDGCTISAYSTLWTHFSGGDTLQGCRFDETKPCTLGDDVWIGVQCSVAPVGIGDKALLLAGSVLTKDAPGNTIWAGNPARDLTDKLGAPYAQPGVEEKFAGLCRQLAAYYAQPGMPPARAARRQGAGRFTLGELTVAMADGADQGTSVFDVRDRTYSKLRTPAEIGFMRFLLPRIKFYPR